VSSGHLHHHLEGGGVGGVGDLVGEKRTRWGRGLAQVWATHRDALKGGGVEGPVDLIGDVLVVVVEVLQAQPLLDQLRRGLVEGQGQRPDGIVGQWSLLEAACLLRVLAQPLLQLLDELLGRLGWGTRWW